MHNPLLQLEGVTKRFGGVTAVENITLNVFIRELRCVIGPNGAGKSTLFRLITGMYPPTGGEIFYNGYNITSLSTFERARHGISMKFQTPMVYYDRTVGQNVLISLQRHYDLEKAGKMAVNFMKNFGLAGMAGRLAGEVAHGYRQWLEICMAVATNPELLLLDEPTAGMSAEETARTAELIHRLNDLGMTILVIDHDMEFVRLLNCDLTVLHLGKFFAQGKLSEIQAHAGVRDIYLGKR
ncbi:MAG: ATP-binding cassette domain-containing protein [Planctomycetota bacterium]|nr:ATP-binding cassette domain-containing protein [Planctomycetota bacterium]